MGTFSGLETLNKRLMLRHTSKAVQNARPEADSENTSDAQPLAQSTRGLAVSTTVQLSDEAATLLETLSNVAESDQGNNAADLLLQEIHGYPHQERNSQELAEFTDKLLGVRQTIVPRLALRIFSRDSRWSQEEWREWIAEWTFDRDIMNKAIDIWRDELFLPYINASTRHRENNAANHAGRREIRRNAFRAWQKEQYGQAALAKIFLKFPLTKYTELLEHWQKYTSSNEYKEQRLRHLPRDHRSDTACQPPVYMEGRGSGSSQSRPDTFIGSRDAPGSIKMFRTYAADTWIADQLTAPPATDQDARASIPLWGRGSRHYE